LLFAKTSKLVEVSTTDCSDLEEYVQTLEAELNELRKMLNELSSLVPTRNCRINYDDSNNLCYFSDINIGIFTAQPGLGNLILSSSLPNYNGTIASQSNIIVGENNLALTNSLFSVIIGSGCESDGTGNLVHGLNNTIISDFAAIVGGSSNCIGCAARNQFPSLYQYPFGATKPGSAGAIVGSTGSEVSGTTAVTIGGSGNGNSGSGSVTVGCTSCSNPSGFLTKEGYYATKCMNTVSVGGSSNKACGTGSTIVGGTGNSNNGGTLVGGSGSSSGPSSEDLPIYIFKHTFDFPTPKEIYLRQVFDVEDSNLAIGLVNSTVAGGSIGIASTGSNFQGGTIAFNADLSSTTTPVFLFNTVNTNCPTATNCTGCSNLNGICQPTN